MEASEFLWNFLLVVGPYVLLIGFIVGEITCVAKTGTDLFGLLFRAIYRKTCSTGGALCVAIPDRLQTQIINQTLQSGDKVKVVEQLPLTAEHRFVLMTAKEAKAPVDSILTILTITKKSFTLIEENSNISTPAP